MNHKSLFIFCLISLLFPFVIRGASSSIIINEIAWMGTENSSSDEWIELYNTTAGNITVDGWILKAEDGSPEIKLSGIIAGGEFFLLERTDDETVEGITADVIYTGALSNSGEKLKLYNDSGGLVDKIDFSGGWTFGDNKTKQTMERTKTNDWQTSQNPGGTPKAMNYELRIMNQESDKPVPEQIEQTAEPAPLQNEEEKVIEAPNLSNYPKGVIFSEILPSPEGPDSENEWTVLTIQPKNLGYLLQLISCP